MYYFRYNIDYYDENCQSDSGIVAAKTFKEAIETITNYYGDDSIESLSIDYSECEDVMVLKSTNKNLVTPVQELVK
jgi:hypothetical protein